MLIAVAVLAGLVVVALINLIRPDPVSALALVVLCAAWLPANNTHLEGPILWRIDPSRGLSTADLASYGGFLLAQTSLVRWCRQAPPSRKLRAVAMAALLSGVLAAAMTFDWVFQSL